MNNKSKVRRVTDILCLISIIIVMLKLSYVGALKILHENIGLRLDAVNRVVLLGYLVIGMFLIIAIYRDIMKGSYGKKVI